MVGSPLSFLFLLLFFGSGMVSSDRYDKGPPHTRHPSPEIEHFRAMEAYLPSLGGPEGGEASRAYAQVSPSTHACRQGDDGGAIASFSEGTGPGRNTSCPSQWVALHDCYFPDPRNASA